jgi:gentisate 1,2-dioxygenase
VIQGHGRTELDNGKALSWEENDVFVVPSGSWYRHINEDAKSDVLLYAVSDEPTLAKLGFFKRYRRTSDGKVVSR